MTADYPQTSTGGAVTTFDHRGGNEWWVEARVTGGDIYIVYAIESDGDVKELRLNDWGNYVGSMHIEPGNTIRFTANARDGGPARESCWFTHPAGVEQCTAPPPPPPPTSAWSAKDMGYAGVHSYTGDMAVGDGDRDGANEVYSATESGLFQFKWTGSSWVNSQRIGSLSQMTALAVGDGNGDGLSEVYVMTNGAYTSSNLVRYTWVNNAWTEETLLTLPGGARDMTISNIDGLPGSEIYVGLDDGVQASIYRVRFTDGVVWEAARIATPPGQLHSLWIGDGDRDGTSELYVGHGTLSGDWTDGTAMTSRLRSVAGSWEFQTIDQVKSAIGKQYVVAGDGDRDGKAEVYSITSDGKFRSVTFNPATGWSPQALMQFSGGSGLFLGDGDGDGSQELYVPDYGGRLFQLRWSGAAWVVTEVARPMNTNGKTGDAALVVVGDGDNDGIREAYLGVSYRGVFPDPGHIQVYQVVAPRNSGFDATFAGVRGNEYWEQASVLATGGTLAKVDVSLNGGTWKALAKQSWGGYAASYRAVEGTVVQFRAASSTGATDLSDCYRWIPMANQDAAKVTCGSPPPPPPPAGFDATFTGVKGNNWWVEAKVTANQGITKVEARVNCGTTWQTLTLQSWGSYAKSFNVPSGAKVDFRATSTSGATDLSGGYTWPQATAAPPC